MSNMGREKSSSSSSSSPSRKSRKSSIDKPKQPQRGLGVAQLEQIRLRSEMEMSCNYPSSTSSSSLIHGTTNNNYGFLQEDMRGQGVHYGMPQSSTSYPCSQSSPSTPSPFGHNPNFMMLFGDERANVRYQDSQPNNTARWNPNGTSVLDSSTYAQEGMASRHLLSHLEESRQPIDSSKSMGSSSQNSKSSEHNEEVDLELRLSI